MEFQELPIDKSYLMLASEVAQATEVSSIDEQFVFFEEA